jgi:Na+-transporting methylmalonyl-CoA/oxaloacetate decarboxylase gamma subunit
MTPESFFAGMGFVFCILIVMWFMGRFGGK